MPYLLRLLPASVAAYCLVIAPAAALQLPGAERPLTDAETGFVFFLLGMLVVYVIPTVIAFARRHPNRWAILVINVVFGGTGLGWLGSLVWAMSAVHRSPTGNHGGESGLNLFANDTVAVKPDTGAADQLLRLKRLFDDGVLNETEYQAHRGPLVDRLSRE